MFSLNLDLNLNFGNKIEKIKFKDFEEFASYVFNENKGFYNLQPFQLEIAEWRLQNLKGVSMLLATRGIGKSDLITCLTSLYLIYLNPTESLIIITDKATKAQRLLKFIKDIIIANAEVFDFIDFKRILQKEIRTKENKRKEPSIFIGSLGETLRGIHPNYAVFDDILTRETAWSSATRESVFEKYEEVKKLTSNILIIGNVCHPLDLYSKLRLTTIPKFEIYHDDDRIPSWLKPNLDKERAEGVSEENIQANYFGVLLPDTTAPFYDIKTMEIENIDAENLEYTCFYDFSMGKRDANALAIAFLYNFKCYVLGFARVSRWSDFIEETAPILKNLGINRVFYENNTTGDEAFDHFEQHSISSTGLRTTLNKRLKINRLVGYGNDLILIKTNDILNNNFIDDFKHYNPSDHNCRDDAVDSTTMCLIQMGYINLELK